MVRRVVIAAALLVSASWGSGAWAGVIPAPDPIPGHYVIVLEEGVARGPVDAASDLPSVREVARSLGRSFGFEPGHLYQHAVRGFSAVLGPEQASALAGDPRVALVEEDGRVRPAQATQVAPPSWGLDRVDQRALPLDGTYRYGSTGAGVHVFVVDSGVRSSHMDLAGRVDAVEAFSSVPDGLGTEDCFGHGTRVAGVVGGTLHGVAKGVTLHPARVLDCAGNGAVSDVVAAVDWATATHLAHQKGKPTGRWEGVGLLSLSFGGTGTVLNRALYDSIAEGLTWVVAAGNDGIDACTAFRPALGVAEVIAVGATTSADLLAPFSNTGACIDLFAPGAGIRTTDNAGDTATSVADGTSLAAAHVAGAAALLLEADGDLTPHQVERALEAYATGGVPGGLPAGTSDRLVYAFFGGDGVDEPPVPWFDVTCRREQRNCAFDASGSMDDVGVVSYTWDFGDGETVTRNGSGVHHKYNGPGDTFTVTLTLTDTAGGTATLEREVSFLFSP